MILDLLEAYRKSADGDALVIDNYQLKEGLYFKLYGSHQEPEILQIEKKGVYSGELWEFIKTADFYSQLVDMNKPVDPKKQIHSNNIYAVAFKAAALLEGNEAANDLSRSINRYYQALGSPKKEDLKVFNYYQLPPVDKQVLRHNQEYSVSLIGYIQQQLAEYKIKGTIYVKLYFAADIEAYIQESKRYLIPKIFNKNDYNIVIDGVTYGLSNSNMGLNAKKPFLEHKTTAFKVPFRLSVADALEAKNMFTWLNGQQDAAGKPITEGYLPVGASNVFTLAKADDRVWNAHYLHVERGAQAVIDDYDYLPGLTDTLMPTFKLDNFLQLDSFGPRNVQNKAELEAIVDDLLFNKNLVRNYFTKSPKPSDWLSSFQTDLLVRYRDALRNYFRKGDQRDFVSCIDQLSKFMLKEMLLKERYKKLEDTKVAQGLNLRLSLLKYFAVKEKEDMGDRLSFLSKNLSEKFVNSDGTDENISFETDDEFYYCAGQVVRYLISRSQAQNPNHSIIDSITDARDNVTFKKEIFRLYKKYTHSLGFNDLVKSHARFNKLFGVVIAYDCKDNKLNTFDLFLSGVVSKNMIDIK